MLEPKMFQKPYNVKSQTAIKGSDRKQLRRRVSEQLLQGQDAASIVPNKEELVVAKVYAHGGTSVTIYVLKLCPILFEIDRILYPTVYQLWKTPGLLPTLFTWPPVVDKLQKGADLMLPGVVSARPHTPEQLGSLENHSPCAVATVSNGAAVAVGYATMSSQEMIAADMKGKGVLILHTYMDHLWKFGGYTAQIPQLPGLSGTRDIEEEVGGRGEEQEDKEIVDEEPKFVQTGGDAVLADMLQGASLGEEPQQGASIQGEDDAESDPEVTRGQMDALLKRCLLEALKVTVTKADLPLLTSALYRNHMLPCCQPGETLDIKKSSYKKLGRFLSEMKADGLLAVKEQSKGVEVITEVFKSHPDLRGFVAPERGVTEEEGAVADFQVTRETSVVPQVTEKLIVSAATSDVFSTLGLRRGAVLSEKEVREALTQYVKQQELQDPRSKNLVQLDPVLAHTVCSKQENMQYLQWPELFSRLIGKMNRGYELRYPGRKPEFKKGTPPTINIKVEQRAGNKKMTLVEGLEGWGMNPSVLAGETRRALAASAAVAEVPGGRGKALAVQGNHASTLLSWFTEDYKLPPKFVAVDDKFSKKKKK